MTALLSAPIWLGFAALAIPLLFVAESAYRAAEIYEIDADPDAHVGSQRGVLPDGTVTQTVEYAGAGSGAASVATYFGPFGIAANARRWAAIAVFSGLLLAAVGLAGLLHFPTRVPLIDHSASGVMRDGEQPHSADPGVGSEHEANPSTPAQ